MADDWLGLQPPTTCGKRPRSPVDKLADLAASAEDDEQDWRSSKRYLTEVGACPAVGCKRPAGPSYTHCGTPSATLLSFSLRAAAS